MPFVEPQQRADATPEVRSIHNLYAHPGIDILSATP